MTPSRPSELALWCTSDLKLIGVSIEVAQHDDNNWYAVESVADF